jgi:hypothetical protein
VSQIEIIPESSVLPRGQVVPVKIRAHFDKPTKIRGIKARFHGAERTEADYTTTTTDSKGNTTTNHHTAVQFVNVVQQDFVLHGDPAEGCFATVADSVASLFGGGSGKKIDAGSHEFDVEVSVPPDAPASFTGKKCSVFYRLLVQVDVPLWTDPKSEFSFTVLPVPQPEEKTKPILKTYPDPVTGRGFWDKTFGKNVQMDVALDRDCFKSGEEVSGMISLRTIDPLKLNRIAISMIGVEYSEADGHTDNYRHAIPVSEIATPAIITNEFVQEFSFRPVADVPATNVGTKFRIEWSVEVRLDVSWAKDTIISIPVVFTSSPE